MLGHFAEGEKFCRAAIEINPSRPNGHKNLGIALAGQGQYREAAGALLPQRITTPVTLAHSAC